MRNKTGANSEYDGRPLDDWLRELMGDDRPARKRASEVVQAMAFGLASPEADFDMLDGRVTPEQRDEAFAAAVQATLSAAGFDARGFLLAAARRLVAGQAAWIARATKDDEQYDRILDRLAARAESSDSDEAKQAALRRMGRAMCAAMARDDPEQEAAGDDLMANVTLGRVFSAAGPLVVEAPEAVWMLFETRGLEFVADEALRRAGPSAAPAFLGELLHVYLEEWNDAQQSNHKSMLARIGRGDARVIAAMLGRMDRPKEGQGDRDDRPTFAWVLAEMREAAATPEVVETLRQFCASPDAGQRMMAAGCVGEILPDKGEAVDRLLALTEDADAEVVGLAIFGLGRLAAEPARVVPRLGELLSTFDEYDPDMGYGGDMARVLDALAKFGPDAAPAVGAVAAYLRGRAGGGDVRFGYWRFPAEALDVLEGVDPADAAAALNALAHVRAAELADREREAADRHQADDDEPDDDPADDPDVERLDRLIARLRSADGDAGEPRHGVP